jgi:hypothetical protein
LRYFDIWLFFYWPLGFRSGASTFSLLGLLSGDNFTLCYVIT